MQKGLSCDIEQAKRFLTILDETAEKFTFQTFDDKPTKNPALARWVHGDIDALFTELVNYNRLGAGVFVMVQSGDGSGRNIKAVNRIRCIFNENDHGVPKKQPLEPQIVVETSPGKAHHYFLTDGLGLDDFKPIQDRLITDYGSDKNANDLPRVLRVPGFYHNKQEPHLVTIVHESGGQAYTKEQIVTAFPPHVKEPEQRKESPLLTDKLSFELRSALGVLRADDYTQWVKIGLALSSLGDVGRGLWLEWSSQYAGFDFAEACKKWETFKPDSIGYKTVFADAQAAGWCNSAKKLQQKLATEEENILTFSCADSMADTATAPNYLINRFLETDSHGILAGASMAFKSFMALAIAHSICNGVDFFGHKSFGAHKVVYVCGEGRGALSRRMRAVKIVHGGFNDNLLVLDGKIRIDNEDDIRALNIHIQRIRPALVIFDTFSSMNSNTNENDNSEVASALGVIHRNLSNGFTSSMIVHHFGKDEERGIRGASAFTANSDFIMLMKREDMDSMEVVLKSSKTKDGDNMDEITAIARVVELGIVAQDGTSSTSLILDNVDIKKRGRPELNNDILDHAYGVAINDEPVDTNMGIGVKRAYFVMIAISLMTQNPSSKRVIITNYINNLKKQGVMTESAGVLVKLGV